MKTYTQFDAPAKIYGAPLFASTGTLDRLPPELRARLGPDMEHLGRRCPGARMALRTDSETFTVRMTLETLSPDVGVSIFGCQAISVYAGNKPDMRFLGLVNPPNYQTFTCERTFTKRAEMEDIMLWLPRNEVVASVSIDVEDGARVEAPTPYKYPVPIVYYGSSITEGGCPSRFANSYNAIICRRLDADYVNLGFSGRARGELEMAEYINTLEKSVFVMDYDHNTPTAEHLLNTHEPFFQRIRAHDPELPVVMISAPDIDYLKEGRERRDIVRRTWERARAAGDENVYFIDGETLFGDADREMCTVDACHPTDLGFYRMAGVIEPVLRKILEGGANKVEK